MVKHRPRGDVKFGARRQKSRHGPNLRCSNVFLLQGSLDTLCPFETCFFHQNKGKPPFTRLYNVKLPAVVGGFYPSKGFDLSLVPRILSIKQQFHCSWPLFVFSVHFLQGVQNTVSFLLPLGCEGRTGSPSCPRQINSLFCSEDGMRKSSE